MSKLKLCNSIYVEMFADYKNVTMKKSVWFKFNSPMSSKEQVTKTETCIYSHKTGCKIENTSDKCILQT